MKFTGILLIIAMLSLSIGCNSSSDSSTGDTIKIGLLVSYSGTLVCAGNYWKAAAELAAYEINNSGGLFDKKIEIITEDAESDPTKAVIAARRLVGAGVRLIIGADRSDSTLSVAQQVTIPKNMLLISPISTDPEITTLQDNDLVWRLVPSDAIQGRVAANYSYSQLNRRTAGIIFIDTAYGKGLATAFQKEFEALGGTVTASVAYPSVTGNDLAVYDFSSKMAELFANSPEAIYLASYFLDGAKITHAMKSHITTTYTPQLFGVDGNYGTVFKGNADPDVIKNMVGTKPDDTDVSRSNYLKFKTNYEAAFAVSPTLYSETTYDAVYLLVYAMLAANSTQPSTVAPYLRIVSSGGEVVNVADYAAAKEKILSGSDINYSGASDEITFDANGDVTDAKYAIWQIKAGDYVDIALAKLQDDTVRFDPLLSMAIRNRAFAFESDPLLRTPRTAGLFSGTYNFCR